MPPEHPSRLSTMVSSDDGIGCDADKVSENLIVHKRISAGAAYQSENDVDGPSQPRPPHRPSKSPGPPPSDHGPSSGGDPRSLRRQLFLILLLRCLRSANLSSPVMVPYLSSPFGDGGAGLTPPEILWLGSCYSLFVIAAEMPSGYLSDRWGRRRTLRAAFACLGASLAAAALAGGNLDVAAAFSARLLGQNLLLPVQFCRGWSLLLLSQLLRAFGSALFSGTDMALLFETLKKYGESSSDGCDGANRRAKEEVLAIESYHVFASTVTEAAFSAAGGMLAGAGMLGRRGTVLVSAAPFCFSAVLCALLEDDCPKKRRRRDGGQGRKADRLDKSQKVTKHFRRSLSSLLPPPGPLRNVFPVGVALNCATYVAATALNPLLWTSSGIGTSYFGWLGAANQAASAGSALCAPALTGLVSPSGSWNGDEEGGTVERGGCAGIERKKEAAMGRLLELLLMASALAYGLMAASASMANGPMDGSSTTAACLAIAGSLLLSSVRGLAWPILGSAINGTVADDSLRATTLSLFAGMIKAGMVGTGFVLGMVLEVEDHRDERGWGRDGVVPGLRDACAICGIILMIFAVFFCRLMVRQQPQRRQPGVPILEDRNKKGL